MSSVYSMTGYASVESETSAGTLAIELRSVNSRFLDLTVKAPENLAAVEPLAREKISARVKRGKVECRLALRGGASGGAAIDPNALASLLALQEKVLEAAPAARPLSVAEIIASEGVLGKGPAVDAEKFQAEAAAAFDKALDIFNASREREGASLARVMLDYCDDIESIAKKVGERLPEILAVMKEKLEERLKSALSSALAEKSSLSVEEVNERITAELTLYALKMDVSEEINRLLTHVEEIRRCLRNGGPIGRRLDFLMQELNREANTLGSKAVAIEMTDASVNLKIDIEKSREQCQNIE